MKRFASIRFDGVLAASERDELMRAYSSAGATVTSWAASATRTYATIAYPPAANVPADLTVLRVTPASPQHLAALAHALSGAGRPAGIGDAYRDGAGIVVEFDPRRTPLALIVALVDAEAGAFGRTIEALVPLDDATLTAFAGSLLGDATLDPSRLIETYVEPLLAASRA